LESVTEINDDIEDMAGEPGSSVGTGGMRSKIDAFKITMASGIPAFLGKSGNADIIYDAVQHTAKGTYFESADDAVNLDSKKQWIAFNSGPEGEIMIDSDAKDRILEQKESLTINDIYTVKGRFDKGAVVRILDNRNEEIGLGMVNYRSGQLKNPTEIQDDQIAVEIDHLVCHIEFPIPVGV
jgi:glutamate 5-kinase